MDLGINAAWRSLDGRLYSVARSGPVTWAGASIMVAVNENTVVAILREVAVVFFMILIS